MSNIHLSNTQFLATGQKLKGVSLSFVQFTFMKKKIIKTHRKGNRTIDHPVSLE